MGAEVGVFALVALLAARAGTVQLAAHQVAISLASFTFTVALGVAAAGSVRVGLAIGAGNQQATRLAGHAAFAGGAMVMGASALTFAVAPRALARLITDQRTVLDTAVPLLLVVAVFQLSDGIQAVGAGLLSGAADTVAAVRESRRPLVHRLPSRVLPRLHVALGRDRSVVGSAQD